MAATSHKTWATQHFRTPDDKFTDPIKRPRHGNHSYTVTSANMAEEQYEKTEAKRTPALPNPLIHPNERV
jgi:hypothetical protein